MSRVSRYKPEYCDELIEFLAQGYSITAFAGSIGVGRRTVFDWLDRHVEFAEAYEIAKSKAVLYWETEFRSFAQTGKGAPAAYIFALKNRASDDWRDVQVKEIRSDSFDDISADTIAEIRKQLAAERARRADRSGRPETGSKPH